MDNSVRSNVSAIVEYDYTANEPDELDLVKGAIITNIKIQPGGWWEGILAPSGKSGMFPDNFVRILDADEKSPVVLRDKSSIVHRRCKVIYSYNQHNEDELSLAVGNIIEILGEVEEGWWRGKLADKIGVFPSNFVVPIETSPILANKRPNSTKKDNRSLHSSREDLLSTLPINLDKDAPILPPKPIREYCRVLFPYDPQNEDELELQIGEIITIISKDLPDKGWWRGELRGKIGVFPDNFVKLLPLEVSPSKESHDKAPTTSSKVFIKKSGSGSSSQGSNRKDSFGSRDSLNDILSETGIISGNVAAQRKSLENKNIDLTNIDPKARRSLETKATETRKSLESMDDKKTPPPVLTKKPVVPVKKTTTVTSVAGSILSGLKQKVKSVENRMSSHDNMDGIGSSRPALQISDNNDKGIIGEKFKKDDYDFDYVERGSMLQDMRASRVKAPKRRLPSAASNVIGESNNNDSIFINGGGAYESNSEFRTESMENDELAKPKPREWAKKKAPWMEELKASQAKKTTPNVEPRAVERVKNEPELNSKNATDKSEMIRPTSNSYSSQRKLSETTTISSSSNASYEVVASTFESSNRKEINDMTKSMSSMVPTKTPPGADSVNNIDDIKSRPTSLSILNRSVSPIGRTSLGKTRTTTTSILGSATSIEPLKANNNVPINKENVCSRVFELEERVEKLESTIQAQNKIIEELVRSFKEETDKVKGLKTELDKYAQCVTQV